MTSYTVKIPSQVRDLIRQETGISVGRKVKYNIQHAMAGLVSRVEGDNGGSTSFGASFGAEALTADFLGGGVLKPPNVTVEPQKVNTYYHNQRLAQQTAQANTRYHQERGAENAAALAFSNTLAKTSVGKAGVDWGLIPMGAKVIATGAAIVASGGAAGAILGGGLTVGGAVAAGTAVAAGAKSVQSITAGAKKVEVFKVLAEETGIPAIAAADKILGDPSVKNAREIIENTQAAAALGDTQAKLGAAILGAVAQLRQSLGVGPGQVAVQSSGANEILMRTNVSSSVDEIRALAQSVLDDYRGWFVRLKDWIRKVV